MPIVAADSTNDSGNPMRIKLSVLAGFTRATLALMDEPAEAVQERHAYNLAGVSFTPAQIAQAIRAQRPGFAMAYAPDFRQGIADSWPRSIDDSAARADWGWQPAFDLAAMTQDMLDNLGPLLAR